MEFGTVSKAMGFGLGSNERFLATMGYPDSMREHSSGTESSRAERRRCGQLVFSCDFCGPLRVRLIAWIGVAVKLRRLQVCNVSGQPA